MPRTVLASGLNALHPCLQLTCPLSCAACSRPLLLGNSLLPRPSRGCQPLPTSLTISSKSPALPLNREAPRLCPHPTLSLTTLATPHPTRASAHISLPSPEPWFFFSLDICPKCLQSLGLCICPELDSPPADHLAVPRPVRLALWMPSPDNADHAPCLHLPHPLTWAGTSSA